MNQNSKHLLFIILALLIITGIYLGYGINRYDLWAPDEPRYAEVAREMLLFNDYILPHFNGKIYYQKPPFFFWEIIFTAKLLNREIDSLCARLPSVTAATLIILLVFLYTYRVAGLKAGIISSLILATTGEFFWAATRAQIDISLVLFTTAAGLLFYSSILHPSNKIICVRKCVAFLFMGIGTLIKGPVSLLPILAFLVFIFFKKIKTKKVSDKSNIIDKSKEKLADSKLKYIFVRAIISSIIYLFIYLFVVGLWLFPVIKSGGVTYWQNTVIKQTIGRTVDSFSHKMPVYYYLQNFPGQSLPWFFFFIAALVKLFKTRRFESQLCKTKMEFIKFNFIWFATLFIVFSAISGKRELYLLQAYPAFAIISGIYISEIIEEKIDVQKESSGFRIASIITGALITIAGAAVLPITKNKFPDFINLSVILAIIFTVSGIIILVSAFKKMYKSVIVFIILLMFVTGVYLKYKILPTIDKYKSYRKTGEIIANFKKNNSIFLFYGNNTWLGGVLLHGKTFFQEIQTKADIIQYVSNASIETIILLAEYEDIQKLYDNATIVKTRVYDEMVGHRRVIILKLK